VLFGLFLVAGELALAGCRGSYDASVKGYVTLDGKALSRGTISFQPAQNGSAAYARINEDGSYALRTGREYGVPSGSYDVTVISNEEPKHEEVNGGPPPAGKPITPAWYRTKQASPLKFTVKPGANEINLDLTSTPPPGYKVTKQR
jgi:hypothetical protein